jgi:hypothetical protein
LTPSLTLALQIIGITVDYKISIGDIIAAVIAVAGLLITAVIFWIGYSRTRATQQIATAASHWDDIETKLDVLSDWFDKKCTSTDETDDEREHWHKEAVKRLDDLRLRVQYFTVLKRRGQIDNDTVMIFYSPKMVSVIEGLIERYKSLNDTKGVTDICGYMNEWVIEKKEANASKGKAD